MECILNYTLLFQYLVNATIKLELNWNEWLIWKRILNPEGPNSYIPLGRIFEIFVSRFWRVTETQF